MTIPEVPFHKTRVSSQAGHSLGITRQVMRQGQDQAKKAARSSCLFAGHELKHSSPSRYWTMLKNTLVHTNRGLHTEHHAFPVSAWNRKDMKVPYLFKILEGLKKSFCHWGLETPTAGGAWCLHRSHWQKLQWYTGNVVHLKGRPGKYNEEKSTDSYIENRLNKHLG